ncbi:hypothetical protein BCR44DRAFT_31514 [Catenaria anguillulae PL171]|uniref:COG complex component COG2 C-terminal domain-containing protein n=1 Tax=Catenaria anguillulae PL171 TaxID=765915 RepID=A0A1Y2HVC7_9FUNG|nr:hypothetical protein BCR44DRAFT_31514 [Catenaria anguillulae PL171]
MDERSLRSLKADLTRQKHQVRARIVHAVNHHYPKYQAVVGTLISSRDKLAGARDPLKVLEDEVQLLEASASEEHAGFKAKLAELERVRHHKKLLLFFLDAQKKLAWLESQLGLPSESEDQQARNRSPTADDPDAAQAITSLARLDQLTLLHSLLRASIDPHSATYPFLATLSTRLDLVGSILERSAHAYLSRALDEFRTSSHIDEPAFQACARVYIYLDSYSQLIVAYITTQIDPILLSARSASRQLPTYLRTVHDQLLAGPLKLLPTLRAASPLSLATSLAHHVLLRLVEALDTGLTPSHYSASVPSAFHRNYSAVVQFFSDMLAALELAHQVDHIPELAALMRRWPVETYFQLISRQIAGDVEANPRSGDNLVRALERMGDGWVAAVAHRFWKLSVQVIRRYHLALGQEQGQATTPPAASELVQNMVNVDATHARVVACKLVTSAHPLIAQGLAPVLASGRTTLFATWQQVIVRELGDNAIQVLRLTRSIAAQFRATGRPAPTSPSSFIPVVFKDMTDLMSTAPKLEDVWAAVVPKVVDLAVKEYTAVVADLLETLKKTEESLRRLKQAKSSRGGTGGGGGGTHAGGGGGGEGAQGSMSDEEKIRVQVGLDVQGLEKVVAGLAWGGGVEGARAVMAQVREVVAKCS